MSELTKIAPLLLAWWDLGHANHPWRNSGEPYAIWISEVMLQQTQIATVIPYYNRWMSRFPDVQTLASSSLDDVLKLWEGLGYYARARNLHLAAQQIVSEHNGYIPTEVKELRNLPGIGPYTAGAIASIAYDSPVPILDGNITRVITRLFDLPEDITQSSTKNRLWEIAAEMVPDDRPGDYNQSLMELGQTICLKAVPLCHICPLSDSCLARDRGTQLERPVRPPRRKTPHFQVAAAIISRNDNQILITRRPLNGLLGGLWEFPGGKREEGESLTQALQREIEEELKIQIEVGKHLTTIKHAYTHFQITLYAFFAKILKGRIEHIGVDDHAWVSLEDVDKYAFAVTDRKIIEELKRDRLNDIED